jgi:hypothetical protein
VGLKYVPGVGVGVARVGLALTALHPHNRMHTLARASPRPHVETIAPCVRVCEGYACEWCVCVCACVWRA